MTEISHPERLILVVEDQADLRKLVSLTLGRPGRTLIEAATAAEALARLEQCVPDIILLDVMLPGGMNGVEVCRRIKSDPRFSRSIVILMTAADQAEQREHATQAGADRYVSKPFSPRALRELVASLLDQLTARSLDHG